MMLLFLPQINGHKICYF